MARELCELHRVDGWQDLREAVPYIRAIFSQDEEFQLIAMDALKSEGLSKISGLPQLVTFLRSILNEALGTCSIDARHFLEARLKALEAYHEQLVKTVHCYRPVNPAAVFWPDPTRNALQTIYNTYPVVKNFELIDQSTPISSAGSCFAYEIAYSFQRRGFNYVVTEKAGNPKRGIFAYSRRHEGEDQNYARFSANWGLLFNTGNLRQMAERAFGVRELPRIVNKISRPLGHIAQNLCQGNLEELPLAPETEIALWVDPFREDVAFLSPEAYEKDYPIHTANCRAALMKAKVFIATIGLSEAWEVIEDGSIISYNPGSLSSLNAVTRPKLLTVRENIDNMQKFIDIIRKHNPEMQFIFTLSPISLAATFRQEDNHVITADGYSKANLRVAIEEVVNANANTYYFPSYELVNRCVKDPWDDDERHVKKSTVKEVMRLFDMMFVKPSEATTHIKDEPLIGSRCSTS